MGLDLYVGTLTRYYSGQWETIIAQYARLNGIPFTVVRHEGSAAPDTDPAIGEVIVTNWRASISDLLVDHLPAKLSWNEGMEPPYFSDKPDWDGLGGLLLWAAYLEHPKLKPPDLYQKDWIADPAFQASSQSDFESRYVPVLSSQLWLPGGSTFAFEGLDAAGQNILISFTPYLKFLLDEINGASWKANETEIQTWRMRGPADEGQPLENQAQFGFSVFYQQVSLALQHNLPMKVDF